MNPAPPTAPRPASAPNSPNRHRVRRWIPYLGALLLIAFIVGLVLWVWAFIICCMAQTVLGVIGQRWLHAVFAGVNGVLFLYAATRLIKLDELIVSGRQLAVRVNLADAPQAPPV